MFGTQPFQLLYQYELFKYLLGTLDQDFTFFPKNNSIKIIFEVVFNCKNEILKPYSPYTLVLFVYFYIIEDSHTLQCACETATHLFQHSFMTCT